MTHARQARSDTRARLLEAAWSTIRTHGLRGATSRRIAAAADANLGAITYHFGSKNDLIGRAAAAQLDRWMAPLTEALLADERDGGRRSDEVIAALLGTVGTATPDTRALLEIMIASDLGETGEILRDRLAGFHDVLRELMTRQRARGEIPDSVRPAAMAGLFTAFAFGLMVQEVTHTNPAPTPSIIGQLLTLLTT